MASIVLSFVGNQDPVSDNTLEEGSIVTLIRHLQSEKQSIRKIILLYTSETKERAEITKEWLEDEPLKIPGEIINLLSVSDNLSDDPVNLSLASQEARQGLNIALADFQIGDHLDFNASSGTPVMKSAWSILQAAGYAPHSTVWQVRNPHKLQPGQRRVFATNVNILKDEFDFKLIKKQVENYNYSGALATLDTSNFDNSFVKALIKYGYYRLGFNFDKAFEKVQNFQDKLLENLWSEIAQLRSKKSEILLEEIYYKASIELKNQQYSDFLILLFAFQENLLRFLIKQQLLAKKFWDKSGTEIENKIQEAVRNYDGGELLTYLKNYRLRNGNNLRLDGSLNRVVMQAILEYDSNHVNLLNFIEKMDGYCQQRNDVVHDLKGVSEIKNSQEIIANMQAILREITNFSKANPFDVLNTEIISHLENDLRGNH